MENHLTLFTVLAGAPEISGLKAFLQGDGIYLISAAAALLIIYNWKQAKWGAIISTLVIYAIVVSLLKGQEILKLISGILKWFGIDVGV